MGTTTTIRLSDRAPVKIVRDAWPIVARVDWHSGAIECQANEIATIRVRVRESGDGPAVSPDVIVYGYRDRGPGGMAAGYRGSHAGYLLTCMLGETVDEDAIVRAIRRVAGALGMDRLADECIADLPAVSL